jgi:hypothetical protein
LASTIAIAAILSGLWQFRQTQRLSREAKAVDLFLKFNELNEELVVNPVTNRENATFWKINALLTITEAVFRLTDGEATWKQTVHWMLRLQEPFLTTNGVNSKTFFPEFVREIRVAVPNAKCN